MCAFTKRNPPETPDKATKDNLHRKAKLPKEMRIKTIKTFILLIQIEPNRHVAKLMKQELNHHLVKNLPA